MPRRLLTRSSRPSLPVSAGNETAGPSSVPSWALRNWQMTVWTGAAAASLAATAAGAVVRCRFGAGGICVLMAYRAQQQRVRMV